MAKPGGNPFQGIARTPIEDAQGNLTRPWFLFFQSLGALVASQDVVQTLAANGEITISNGTVVITKQGGAAITLAAPAPGTDDGNELRIVDTTGYAHVITAPAKAINGNKQTITMQGTGGTPAAGDTVSLVAYGGIWYTDPANGAISLT
jgi:hypothetical protein